MFPVGRVSFAHWRWFGTCCIYDLNTDGDKLLAEMKNTPQVGIAAAFSPDGKTSDGHDDGQIMLWTPQPAFKYSIPTVTGTRLRLDLHAAGRTGFGQPRRLDQDLAAGHWRNI